ncbi:MAG: hypothetical protein ACRCU2_33625 [Planktothrix sp.]
MSQNLTENIIKGIEDAKSLSTLVSSALVASAIVTQGVATIIATGIAFIFTAKIVQIKAINKSNGINWPITWTQWAILVRSIARLNHFGIQIASKMLALQDFQSWNPCQIHLGSLYRRRTWINYYYSNDLASSITKFKKSFLWN